MKKSKKVETGIILNEEQEKRLGKPIGNTKWTVALIDKTDKIATTEDIANTMIDTSHQFNLMTQVILKNKFNFTEEDLKGFTEEMAHALEGLAYFEDKGLHPLSGKSLEDVVDVTMNNYQVLRAARSGLELSADKDAFKLLQGKKK